MSDNPPPIVKVDPEGAGRAPILSYNVPDSTTYTGRNLIRLVFEEGTAAFRAADPVQLLNASPPSDFTDRKPVGEDPEPVEDPPFGDPLTSAEVSIYTPQPGTALQIQGSDTEVKVGVRILTKPKRISPTKVTVRSGAVQADAEKTPGPQQLYEATVKIPVGESDIEAVAEIEGLVFKSQPTRITVTTLETPSPASSQPFDIRVTEPPDNYTVTLPLGATVATVAVAGEVNPVPAGMSVTITVDRGDPETLALSTGKFAKSLQIGKGNHELLIRATDGISNKSVPWHVNVLENTWLPRRELLIAEYLQLSNFLGAYGAGRTIQTFSLLPGERTKITVKTYQSSTEEKSETSSFLDSFSGSSTQALEDAVSKEQTTKSSEDQEFKAAASVEAAGNWGVASAKVSASAAFGTSAARESLGKSVVNAVAKNSSEVSSKRDVQVTNMGKGTETSGSEQVVERTLENINVSRTLNFVFRQMNQEFISILHLVDVRIGVLTRYVDGKGNAARYAEDKDGQIQGQIITNYREITLPQLGGLLTELIRPELVQYVRAAILAQLDTVIDWNGKRREILEWTTFTRPQRDEKGVAIPGQEIKDGPYLRFSPSPAAPETGTTPGPTPVAPATAPGRPHTDTYTDETGNSFDVQGVILQATKVSLRSDGIMVDALLGGGNALDPYSTELQTTAIAEKSRLNDGIAEDLERRKLARELVKGLNGLEAVEAYHKLFGMAPKTEQ